MRRIAPQIAYILWESVIRPVSGSTSARVNCIDAWSLACMIRLLAELQHKYILMFISTKFLIFKISLLVLTVFPIFCLVLFVSCNSKIYIPYFKCKKYKVICIFKTNNHKICSISCLRITSLSKYLLFFKWIVVRFISKQNKPIFF